MSNKEKYINAFAEAFEMSKEDVNESMEMGKTSQWDSVGHMNLVAHMEDAFGIEMEMEDMMTFNTYMAGIEVLAKYDIVIE